MTEFGNAAIVWSATSETMSERVHLLEAPLRELRFGNSIETFTRQSMDRTVFEHTYIGDGVDELIGKVRYDRNAQSLNDMIVAGSQGKTLTYIPDLGDSDVKFDTILVSPISPTALQLDAQRGVLGDQSVEIRLRNTDQGPFDPLIKGTAVLFSYSAGGSLGEATFTRSSEATFVSKGDGTITVASSNEARLEWVSTASTGFRDTPTLLLEGARTNHVPYSEDIAQWTNLAAVLTLTSGQTSPTTGGTDAWLVADNSTSTNGILRSTDLAALTTNDIALSVFVKQGTTSSTDIEAYLRDALGARPVDLSISFSSGEPTVIYTAGSSVADPERVAEGFWRIGAASTAGLSTELHQFRFSPHGGASADGGDVYFLGAQVEQ